VVEPFGGPRVFFQFADGSRIPCINDLHALKPEVIRQVKPFIASMAAAAAQGALKLGVIDHQTHTATILILCFGRVAKSLEGCLEW
jgi:hypothetical protein